MTEAYESGCPQLTGILMVGGRYIPIINFLHKWAQSEIWKEGLGLFPHRPTPSLVHQPQLGKCWPPSLPSLSKQWLVVLRGERAKILKSKSSAANTPGANLSQAPLHLCFSSALLVENTLEDFNQSEQAAGPHTSLFHCFCPHRSFSLECPPCVP
jgi:hypothetical protein